jgi:NADH-quinone oxidoreductase subunit J
VTTKLSAAIIAAFMVLAPLAVMVTSPVDAVAQVVPADADVKAKAGASVDAPARPGFGNSKAAAMFFWLFAIAAVAGSIFVITRRNMVTAVMGMVGTFFAIAALYAMLYAHFLAAIQVLVYAGAIMVLFVFVIMILNRPEEEPWAIQGVAGKGLAVVALLYLLYRLATVLWTVKDQPHAAAEPITAGGFEFGSTKAVGKVLFTDYIFPFEAISIVLLVAVVGAIAIARPAKAIEAEEAEVG